MEASFHWEGMAALKQALATLPADLRGEADHIVEAEAKGALVAIRRVYAQHIVSGRLLKGAVLAQGRTSSRYGVKWVVKSTSPLARLFDHGSAERVHKSGHPTGRMWGHTAPTHIFERSVQAGQKVMFTKLADLIRRYNFRVTGHAA